MRKLAVSISKGGVGKTTTAVNLAGGLALLGKKVLLVDVDTQAQSSYLLGIKPEAGLAEVITEEITIDGAMVQARDNLWMLAGGRNLAGVKRLISRKDYGGEMMLAQALDPVEAQFDYVILDTAPGWDSLTINVLFYAREILAPVSLEVATLQGLRDFLISLADIKKYNHKVKLKYVLPTFMDLRVRKSQEIFGQLQNHFGKHLCSPIRYNVRLSESFGFGQTIYEYAPSSPGAQDYHRLVEKIAAEGNVEKSMTLSGSASGKSIMVRKIKYHNTIMLVYQLTIMPEYHNLGIPLE